MEQAPGPARLSRIRWVRWVPGTLVVAVAFVARLSVALATGGVGASLEYDAGVYYAASAALLNGRVPYRDYTLLHPPGIALLLSPFALMAQVTSDHTAFVAAAVVAMAVGATDAFLVWLIARRLNLGHPAALAAGLFYGVFGPSVGPETLTRLEPFGNLFVLLGVLAFVSWKRHRSTSAPRATLLPLLAGAALAAATSVKIWYVVPLAVVVLWSVVERRGARYLVLLTSGALTTFLLIDGPFFVLAPRQMVQSVIFDQLGRPGSSLSTVQRLESISGLSALHLSPTALHVALAISGAAVVVLCSMSWRVPGGRLGVALFGCAMATLLLSPSYFSFYADYAVPGAALVVAGSVSRRRARKPAGSPTRVITRRVGATTVAVAVAAMAVSASVVAATRSVEHPQASLLARLRPAVTGLRCVQSDQPSTLIDLDVLGRDLRDGCPMWVDVSGRTYGADLRHSASGRAIPRRLNQTWQHDLLPYLRSGDAVILTRPATGASPATLSRIRSGALLARAGSLRMYGTDPRRPGPVTNKQTRQTRDRGLPSHP